MYMRDWLINLDDVSGGGSFIDGSELNWALIEDAEASQYLDVPSRSYGTRG